MINEDVTPASPASLPRKRKDVETVRVSDSLNVDMAPNGTIYGIDLLNANEQLLSEDEGSLVVVNESLGEQGKIALRR